MKAALDIIFFGYLFLTIIGAIAAVCFQSLIRALVGMVSCMFGIAGLYLYLNSPFLAFMQILIYVGAVCIMIFFAIMLAEPPGARDDTEAKGKSRTILAFLASGLPVVVIGLALKSGRFKGAWPAQGVSLAQIGKSFLLQYCLVFELISLILLIAIIGSVLIAKLGRSKNDE